MIFSKKRVLIALMLFISYTECLAQDLNELFSRICYENCSNTDSFISYGYLDELEIKGEFPVKGQPVSVFRLDLNLFDTNFGFHLSDFIANDSGYVNKEVLYIAPFYSNIIFPGTRYQWYYKLMFMQKHYYRNDTFSPQDTYEYSFLSTMPSLLGKGIGWNLRVQYETPAHGGDSYYNRDYAGWYYKTGIDYKMQLPAINEEPTKLRLFWDIAYRDNLGGSQYDSDWTHTTWGVSTDFQITEDLSINPIIQFQKTMDTMVEPEDTLFANIFLRYRF